MPLSRRLSLSVAAIVITVVAAVAYLEMRAYEAEIDRDLESAARFGAQSVADTLGDHAEPLDPADVKDTLHDLSEAAPMIDAMSVIVAAGAGTPHVLTSTSTEERAEVLDLGMKAIASSAVVLSRGTTVVMCAAPMPRHPGYAVAVTVGLESLIHAREHGFYIALGFAVPTMLLVTVFVQLTVRQFVTVPLRGLLATMKQTAEGQWEARAPVVRRDELGMIASGLNAMLDELEGFNRSLQARVDDATGDLLQRNLQLAQSHEALSAARESLARAERIAALGQVAANVAHQAGTPLNLVSGYVQMLRDDPATSAAVRARLETIDKQIQQVARALRSMLDSARKPAGFDVRPVDEVIARVREVAEPRLMRAHITLQTATAPGLAPIRADVTQLEMALLNLVTNALDALPRGGTISLSASATPSGGVRLEVTDNGPGFAPEVLNHLFEVWVTTKPAGEGSGLGLSIVRDVVRAHGGTVSAYNRASGAAVIIDLPAAGATPSHA